MGQAIGSLGNSIGGFAKNAANIQEANMGDLSGGEQAQRGLMGALGGGLSALAKRQQQQPTSGGGQMPMLPPAPQYDFSQIGQPKRNPFYGGY